MEFLKRFFRHVWMSPIQVRRAFPQTVLDAVEQAVAAGEKTHRGQVRFVVEAELTVGQLWAGMTSRQRAIEVFSMLRVWDSEENNGVLIYVLLADRRVEIVADRAIQRQVGESRWQAICREIELHYRKREFAEGSVTGLHKIAVELAHYYPADGREQNTQPDRPVLL